MERNEKIITNAEVSEMFRKEFPDASYQDYQSALRYFKQGWKIETIFENMMFRDFE